MAAANGGGQGGNFPVQAGLGGDGCGELHPENTSSPAHIIAGILSGFMSSPQVSVTKLKSTPVPATLIRVYGNTWRLFDMNERQPGGRSHHQAPAAEPQPMRQPHRGEHRDNINPDQPTRIPLQPVRPPTPPNPRGE